MYFIFFVCIKFTILHLCVSNIEYNCHSYRQQHDIALLVDFYNDEQVQLNRVLLEKCGRIYNIRQYPMLDEEERFLGIVYRTPHTINLYVPDHHDEIENIEEVESNLAYAGDLSNDRTCVPTNRTNPASNCTSTVKLVSKSIKDINSGDLYDFITQMQIINGSIQTRQSCSTVFQVTNEPKTVLLCMAIARRQSLAFKTNALRLQIVETENCKNTMEISQNNFLAVLTPKPFEVDFEYQVPTIFYETSFMSSETETYFPNSMNLVSWPLLKYGFSEFLKKVKWTRVKIWSDYSDFSVAFENELTTLFDKEKIVYAVVRGEDMTTIINDLLDASVIIANVDQRQFNKFPEIRGVVWLVKDLVESPQIMNKGQVFSLSLSPVLNHIGSCKQDEGILEGVQNIAKAYGRLEEAHFNLSKLNFYREFTKLMKMEKNKKLAKHPEAMVKVKRMKSNYNHAEKLVFTVKVNEHGPTEDGHLYDSFRTSKIVVNEPPCLVTSYDYDNPCEDHLILVFMLVTSMFAATLLTIACYFHKTSPVHDIRYLNFA